jgi:hypothetical protein
VPRLLEMAQILLPACQCSRISAISRTVNLLLAIGSNLLVIKVEPMMLCLLVPVHPGGGK